MCASPTLSLLPPTSAIFASAIVLLCPTQILLNTHYTPALVYKYAITRRGVCLARNNTVRAAPHPSVCLLVVPIMGAHGCPWVPPPDTHSAPITIVTGVDTHCLCQPSNPIWHMNKLRLILNSYTHSHKNRYTQRRKQSHTYTRSHKHTYKHRNDIHQYDHQKGHFSVIHNPCEKPITHPKYERHTHGSKYPLPNTRSEVVYLWWPAVS